MHKIFVYGTLKEGFPNDKINKGSRLEGDYLTKNRYPLYLVGKRFSPWLMLEKGNGHNVRGQVFTVNDATLAEMDKLERINELDGYRRIELTVISEESDEKLLVFAYGKPVEQLDSAEIQLELNGEYKLEHALLYISLNL